MAVKKITKIGSFVRHFGEMCLAMCIGAGVFGLALIQVSKLVGITDAYVQTPVLTAIVVLIGMTLPMAAWMRFRGMARRSIVEMSAAMGVETIVLVGIHWLGIIPSGALVPLQHALMVPAMLLPMLMRREVYVGHHAHGAARAS